MKRKDAEFGNLVFHCVECNDYILYEFVRARFVTIDFMDLEGRLGSRDDGSEAGDDDLIIKRLELAGLEMAIKCQ